MAAINTSKQSILNASKFIEDYVNETDYLYLAIAKSDPWNNDIASSVDLTPFSPKESQTHFSEFRSNLIAMKRVLPNQFVKVVPRYDWQSGTTYTQWDDQFVDPSDELATIETQRFYVITNSFDV